MANHRRGIRSFTGPKAERLTVADLLDALEASYRLRGIKSLKRTLSHAKPLREYFADYRAVAVGPDAVRAYIAERTAAGRAPAKINRETQILAAAYSLAFKEQKIASKPHIPHLTEDNARRGFLEAEEHAQMMRHLPAPMDAMAAFAYISGWRKEEIRPLRWENVDRAAKEIRLFDSKNGEGRILPLDDDETWQMFERLWTARQYETPDGPALSEYVFLSNGKPVSEFYFCELWDKARRVAGLPHKLFHDYRRTAARNLVRAGVPQTVAMSITGHKTVSMFQRYNITTIDDKREALRKQREHLSGKSAPSNVASFPNTDRTRTNGK